jgi:hypothetical protein
MPGAMDAFLASITRSSIELVLLNCFTKLERQEEMLPKRFRRRRFERFK